ncbi:WD repeat-containing protein 91 isoform X3 [Phycodurus eques]|uniref:WD repeat-containing protein 91 isoform X3 n=1 Tax=Phycodurus eques TaxID=693459 RepID=UPI002ACEDB6C|nr:WD repeat-containing protein 91 isoform X3 [Phycodurus eques]
MGNCHMTVGRRKQEAFGLCRCENCMELKFTKWEVKQTPLLFYTFHSSTFTFCFVGFEDASFVLRGSEIAMGSAVERTDEHVRGYLLYRGFTSTLKHLDGEIKADKEKGFRVDKIIDQLLQFVQSFELSALKDYWLYLDRRLFCRLEDVYRPTVNKLRASLYRYYVINAVQRGNLEKTQEFFQKQAMELQGQPEWRDWFLLPFIPAPEQNPAFAPYFSRQWSDTFLVSLHNFLSVLFQCMPQPVLLSFDAEVQKTTSLTEENEQLRQLLFALQTESRDQSDGDEVVHHKLPPYVQNMDRLGDTELDLVSSQRAVSVATTPSRNFFSTFLPQGRRTPGGKTQQVTSVSSPSQAAVGRKDQPTSQVKGPKSLSTIGATLQSSKSKDAAQVKEAKQGSSQTSAGEPSSSQSQHSNQQTNQPTHLRHKKIQAHEKERKELFSKPSSQLQEKKGEVGDVEPPNETSGEAPDSSSSSSRSAGRGAEGVGLSAEQPFIKLSQEEYGEHHSSIMHCSILSLACSPSGSSFVCSAAAVNPTALVEPMQVSGQLLLWDTKTVKQQLRFSLEPEPVAINCTAFNHNGNLLVTGAADGVIRLFDMQQYESAMSWRAHDGEVYSVEFSYDENTVFSVGEDGKFIQWNIHRCGVKQSEQVLPQDATGPFVLSGYSGYKQVQVPRGRLFTFDSEGQHVLTCSSSGGIICKLTNGEPALESVLSLGGHKAPVVTVDWCSALDCGTCLTASMDGKIKLSTLLAQKS